MGQLRRQAGCPDYLRPFPIEKTPDYSGTDRNRCRREKSYPSALPRGAPLQTSGLAASGTALTITDKTGGQIIVRPAMCKEYGRTD